MKPKKEEPKTRRGPKLRGDVPRKRFNVSLDPVIVEHAKEFAEKNKETLSGLVERLLSDEIERIPENQ